MFKLKFSRSRYISPLFYKRDEGKLVLAVENIVDDLKASVTGEMAPEFIEKFHKTFKLGTVNHNPGKLRFLGLILQKL